MRSTADPFDRSLATSPAPSARVVSDAAVTALRSAFQAVVGDYAPNADLRRAIRLMCVDARRHQLRAEQLVVIIKQAWNSLPAIRLHSAPMGREQVLGTAITMCIEEYYAVGRGD